MAFEHSMQDVVERMAKGRHGRHLVTRRYEAGCLVRSFDDETDGYLFVRSGRLRSYVSNGGKELTLFMLLPGDAIRVGSGPQLEARRECEVVFVPMDAFRDFARLEPELVFSAMLEVDRLHERAIHMIEEMAFHDVRHRLIRALCDTADREGRHADRGIVIAPPPNAEDIAMQIGATRQSVSTVMATLVRSGILARFGQQSLVISDIDRLRRQLALPQPADA